MGDFFDDRRQLGCRTLVMALVLMMMSIGESSFPTTKRTHDWVIRKGRLEQSRILSVIVNPLGIVSDGPNKGQFFALPPSKQSSDWLVTRSSVLCSETACSDGSKILSVRTTQSISLLWAINVLTLLSAWLLLGAQKKPYRSKLPEPIANEES